MFSLFRIDDAAPHDALGYHTKLTDDIGGALGEQIHLRIKQPDSFYSLTPTFSLLDNI